MLIRYSVNFAAHLVAGVVFGAMAVALADRYRRRHDNERDFPPRPERQPASSVAPAAPTTETSDVKPRM